jgi:hypothetical protein
VTERDEGKQDREVYAGGGDAAADASAGDAKPEASPSEAKPAMDETDDAIFETLWGRVLEAWDDDKPHAAVLEYSLRAQRLPDLAGRYRALKDDRDKGERAQKKLDGIVTAAMQMMMATKTPPRDKPPRNITLSALGMFLLAIALLTYWMFMRP